MTRDEIIPAVADVILHGQRIDRYLSIYDGSYYTTDNQVEPCLKIPWFDAGTPDREESAEAHAAKFVDKFDELCENFEAVADSNADWE